MSDVLAIVGSRRFEHSVDMLRAREIIEDVLNRQCPDEIVSGGAAGIDTLAKIIGDERGIPVEEIRPKFHRWTPDGYEARNIEIVQRCSRLLCIRSKTAKTYGSGWTADYAQRMGKVVWRIEL